MVGLSMFDSWGKDNEETIHKIYVENRAAEGEKYDYYMQWITFNGREELLGCFP